MSEASAPSGDTGDTLVPDDVIPHGKLPPLRLRDLPEPVPFRKLIGPGIILAGLALGSGEFIFWPYITYKSQFVFFWACLLGVTTQYFLNMEISRWTLATGESAITGFCRLSKHWAWVFLIANIIPWMIPAWSRGAAELLTWILWAPEIGGDAGSTIANPGQGYITPLAIAGMFICGAILTAGPVIYNTVEKIQAVLVGTILVLIVVIAVMVVRVDAVVAMVSSTATFGNFQFVPDASDGLDDMFLLGALAFAGVGGTLNLGQSNYIKDKGFGMGALIGRITSPITGQEESITEVGYHFPHDQANLARWRRWWSLAGREHFLSFFATCIFCLVLLTLISYSLLYNSDGQLKAGAEHYQKGMGFVLGEAVELEAIISPLARLLFLVMGIAILLTTEFGVLDSASRISSDIVKVNWLRDSSRWSESKLYYVFLWGSILLGSALMLLVDLFKWDVGALGYFKLTAAMNGGIMFVYALTLLQMNRFRLPKTIRISGWRALILVWAVLFFGYFMVLAARLLIPL